MSFTTTREVWRRRPLPCGAASIPTCAHQPHDLPVQAIDTGTTVSPEDHSDGAGFAALLGPRDGRGRLPLRPGGHCWVVSRPVQPTYPLLIAMATTICFAIPSSFIAEPLTGPRAAGRRQLNSFSEWNDHYRGALRTSGWRGRARPGLGSHDLGNASVWLPVTLTRLGRLRGPRARINFVTAHDFTLADLTAINASTTPRTQNNRDGSTITAVITASRHAGRQRHSPQRDDALRDPARDDRGFACAFSAQHPHDDVRLARRCSRAATNLVVPSTAQYNAYRQDDPDLGSISFRRTALEQIDTVLGSSHFVRPILRPDRFQTGTPSAAHRLRPCRGTRR